MKTTFTQSIVINRPVEEIYNTATCLESCVNWQTTMLEAQKLTDGPARVGSTYLHRARFMGLNGEVEAKITVWDPPYRFAYESDGKIPFQVEFTFEPTDDGGTLFTCTLNAAWAKSLVKDMTMPLVLNALNRQYAADLQSLKEMMEAGMKVRVW